MTVPTIPYEQELEILYTPTEKLMDLPVVRETAMTTLIGLAVGVAVGIPFSLTMIRGFESGTSMYSRTPYPLAWVLSVVLNIIFTVVIDFVSFRKIGKQPLTNVSMQ